MILKGTPEELYRTLKEKHPSAPDCPSVLRAQMLPYQMLALFELASGYNRKGAKFLEIGTGHGASAFMLARGAPQASITTLTVNAMEGNRARRELDRAGCVNVKIVCMGSLDYFQRVPDKFDIVFVDGDHNAVRYDLIWWERVTPGGVFVCHDYSPATSTHPSPIVYAELNEFRERLGRAFDIEIIDNGQTGMAGWVK